MVVWYFTTCAFTREGCLNCKMRQRVNASSLFYIWSYTLSLRMRVNSSFKGRLIKTYRLKFQLSVIRLPWSIIAR